MFNWLYCEAAENATHFTPPLALMEHAIDMNKDEQCIAIFPLYVELKLKYPSCAGDFIWSQNLHSSDQPESSQPVNHRQSLAQKPSTELRSTLKFYFGPCLIVCLGGWVYDFVQPTSRGQ